MKCPLCGSRTFSAGSLQTVVDKPGRKEYFQRRVCSKPECNHHFKVEVILDASTHPEPPEAA